MLWKNFNSFHFMDLETFEEKVLTKDQLSNKAFFLKENIQVNLQIYEERIIGVELPIFVEMEVKKAEPGVKGDTVGSATKLVTIESGYKLQVPLFIKEGDIIKIDTRSGEYVGKK